MGVTYITQWSVEEGKNIQQSIEELSQILEKIGAKKSGLYCVECETFQAGNISLSKTLHIVSNSEYPLSRFAHFEDGSRMITDSMLPNFLSKLGAFWQPKKGAKIECKGHRYKLSDFVLKVGIVTHGSSTRGIAIEVEYTPCIYFRECWPLMCETLQAILGGQAPSSSPSILQSLEPTESYTPEHTSLQYIELFNNCKKVG